MKSIQNRLKSIYESLNDISDSLFIYHYERAEDYTVPYGVWYEEGESKGFHASNTKIEQSLEGRLDFYTLTEFDPLVDDIQECLNEIEGLGWELDAVLYEDETKLIHYSWHWSIV